MKIDWSSEIDEHRLLPWAALLGAMLVALVVYWPALHGPMMFDDYPQLGQFFHQSANHHLTLAESLWSNSGPLGRPVSMLTFWLNSVLTPDNLWAWKLTNLTIHLLCGLLAALLAMELFSAAQREPGIDPRYPGFFVGVIWLLHPLQVSTVLYTVQRMTELAALFMFGGLYAYVILRRDPANNSLRKTVAGLVLLSAATVLAGLSKENGLLLPFLALAVEMVLFRAAGSPAVSRAIRIYFGAVVTLAGLAAALLFVARPHFITGGYMYRPFTFAQRMLSEPRILFEYLRMLLFPIPRTMGFFHDDFAVSTGLLNPVTTLWSLLGLAALTGAAWLVRKRFPLVALGIAIFLIGQVMESSVFALRLMFEHRNYFPGFGIFLAVTDIGLFALSKRGHKLQSVIGGTIVAALAILLAVRATHWTSEISLYHAGARAHPRSETATAGLAQAYLDADKPDLALQVLASHPGYGTGLERAYMECVINGSVADAELQELVNQTPTYLGNYPVKGLTTLGALGVTGKCRFSSAVYSRLIDAAAQRDTTRPDLRYMLYIYSGYYHERLQQIDEAIAAMQNAHRLAPTTPVPLILAARWYLQAGDTEKAGAQLQKARQIDRLYNAGFSQDIDELADKIRSSTGKPDDVTPR